MGIEGDAYRYAVKNAILHKGKADTGAIIGKIKALHADLNIKKTMEIAIESVKKANALEPEELKKEFEKFEKQGWELKPKEKEEKLPLLEWAKKEKVVTRYAPNPNGPFHLGNARTPLHNYENQPLLPS